MAVEPPRRASSVHAQSISQVARSVSHRASIPTTPFAPRAAISQVVECLVPSSLASTHRAIGEGWSTPPHRRFEVAARTSEDNRVFMISDPLVPCLDHEASRAQAERQAQRHAEHIAKATAASAAILSAASGISLRSRRLSSPTVAPWLKRPTSAARHRLTPTPLIGRRSVLSHRPQGLARRTGPC